jgi:predicted ATP-grasp superfamily ATP-dependent carboligase
VLKPIDGAGSLETHYLGRGAGWPTAGPTDRRWLLQPFLPGNPISVSLIIAPARSDAPGWIEVVGTARQHMLRDDGRFCYRGGSIAAPIPTGSVRAVVAALRAWEGLQGWVGVDMIIGPEPGTATVLEVNPRLTTSYVGLRAWVDGGGRVLARRLLESAGWGGGGLGAAHHGFSAAPGIARVEFRANGECTVRPRRGEP